MKYWGIILDYIFRLNENIIYAADITAKLIHNLSKTAKFM